MLALPLACGCALADEAASADSALADSSRVEEFFAPSPASAPQDSVAALKAERARARAVEADSARARDSRRAFSEPGWVMARSAVIPGWGQFYNRQWVKAAAVAGVQTTLALRLADDLRALDDLSAAVDVARDSSDKEAEESAVMAYNARLDQAVRREWIMAGVLLYSLLDAYVDAHFRNFDIEFRQDPALPAGGKSRISARLGLRWTF